MRWFRRRRRVDARDMEIIEIQGAMVSAPKIVCKMFVQAPTFPRGTVTVVKSLKGVLFVEDESE